MKASYPIINENVKKLPFYLTSIGESVKERFIVRKNGFYSNHFLIILSGEGIIECENKKITLKQNDIVFIKKDIPHSYYPLKGEMHDLWVTFDGNGVDSILKYYGIGNFYVCQNIDLTKIIPDFEELCKITSKGVSPERISLLYYNFAIEFFSISKNKNEISNIEEAKKYIEINFYKEISLEELAKICNLSKYSFCRIFKETYQTTPFDYLLQVRIKNAKQILAETPNIKLKELALLCGFNDECYFCRVFKRIEHCTPKQFAKMM